MSSRAWSNARGYFIGPSRKSDLGGEQACWASMWGFVSFRRELEQALQADSSKLHPPRGGMPLCPPTPVGRWRADAGTDDGWPAGRRWTAGARQREGASTPARQQQNEAISNIDDELGS